MKNNDVRNNKIRSVLGNSIRATAMVCATGTLMQTFLVVLGFSSSWIYIHSTLIQTVNVLTIIICSRWADTGNVIKRAAFVNIPMAISFLLYLPLCIWRSSSIEAFAILVIISIIQAILNALYIICEYKLPYYIYRTEDFGSATALAGIITAGMTFALGILINRLSEKFDYITLMFFSFIFALVVVGIDVILIIYQKSLLKDENGSTVIGAEEKVPLKKVFFSPVFLRVWPAHLLRGFSYGTLTVLAVVAVDLGFDEGVTTALVSVQAGATLIGCMMFGIMSKYLSPRIAVFSGSILTILLPFMLFADDKIFLLLCMVVLFGRALVDYGVVALMLYAIPVEIAGPYNAWRMALHNVGALIATMIAAFIPVSLLLWLTLISGCVSGIMFLALGCLRKASPIFIVCRKK